MKQIFTLAMVVMIMFSSLAIVKAQTFEQSTVTKPRNEIILVGIAEKIRPEVSDGLLTASIQRSKNQIALVATYDFTSAYYRITDAQHRVIKTGKFVKRYAGQYQFIELGDNPNNYTITFSDSSALVSSL